VCAPRRNPWLVYAAPLHRLREFGTSNKLLDLLDERALTSAEMRGLLELVLGGAACDLPHPDIDWHSFEVRSSYNNRMSSCPTCANVPQTTSVDGVWVCGVLRKACVRHTAHLRSACV